MSAHEQPSGLFKTLMHPARLEILEILRNGEECVCHMEAALGYRQAYISQQLSVLREARLVQDRRDGWNIFYRVVQPQVYDVIDAARALTGEAPARRQMTRPATLTNCSCPRCSPAESTVPA